MKKGTFTAVFILICLLARISFPGGVRSAAYEAAPVSGWLDILSGVIAGERAEYTVIIPQRWTAFLKAERGSQDLDKGILERILFYYVPTDTTIEPVFLVSILVQDANLRTDIPNAIKVYETNLYLFSIIPAGSNPFKNVTDRGIFRQFLNDLDDIELISGFISVPITQWEVNYNTIKVNGHRISGKSIVKDKGSVYLPLRDICEALDYKVTWHGIDKTITIERGMRFDVITLDENAYVKQSFNVFIENNICYVPMVFFINNLSMNIDIDENNNVFLSEWDE